MKLKTNNKLILYSKVIKYYYKDILTYIIKIENNWVILKIYIKWFYKVNTNQKIIN
jgi:hypothetical protein